MPKMYKKRPYPIQAVQLLKDNRDEVVEFLGDRLIVYRNAETEEPHCIFRFGKRNWTVKMGDYIVKTGTMNLFFCVRQENFEREYEVM